MPENQSSRLCPQCGSAVPPSKGVKPRKFCSKDCTQLWHKNHQNEAAKRETAERRDKAPIVDCPHCGVPFHRENPTKVYCSDKCRHAARRSADSYKLKQKEWRGNNSDYQKEYYEKNKDRLRAEARYRMRAYLKTPEGIAYKQRQRELRKKKGRKRTTAERSLESSRRFQHNAHVKAWRRLHRLVINQKHCSHVSTWKNHLKANPGASARYFKSIGQPWRNRHLSKRCQYAVRYRLDVEFRLGEINRHTWRKKELAARDDGTINFWQLMRERKTCPYCGTKITKENAVADHMDPMKHGGANGQHNLTICCRSCNARKAGRPFVEWLDMLPDDRRNAVMLWYKRKHGHGPEQSSLCFEFKAA